MAYLWSRCLPLLLGLAAGRPTLRLYGSRPDSGGWPVGRPIAWGSEKALADIQASGSFGFDIEVVWHDDQCSRPTAMKQLVTTLSDSGGAAYHGVFGSGCSAACIGLADLSVLWGLPVFSWGCTSPELSNSEKFPFFSRIDQSGSGAARGWLMLAKLYHWGRMAFLVEREDSLIFTNTQLELLDWAAVHAPEVEVATVRYLEAQIGHAARQAAASEVALLGVRVVVFNGYEGMAAKAVCAFQSLGLVGPHWVFLLHGWATSIAAQHGATPCSEGDLRQALGLALGVESAMWSLDGSLTTVAGRSPTAVKEEYYRFMAANRSELTPSDYTSMMYDGIWAFALAMRDYLAQDPSLLERFHHANGSSYGDFLQGIHEAILGVDFIGVTGRVRIAPNGDRIGLAGVRQWDAQGQVFTVIGSCGDDGCYLPLPVSFGLAEPWDPAAPGQLEGRVPSGEAPTCPAGTLLNLAAEACERCPAGKVLNVPLRSCVCTAGFFSNVSLGGDCQACPEGHWCDVPGATAPEPCPPGSYSPSLGGEACRPCPLSGYSDTQGQAACTPCAPAASSRPSLWRSLRRVEGVAEWLPVEGADSLDGCGCQSGSFFDGRDCADCVEGLTCLGKRDVIVQAGYFAAPSAPLDVWRCFGRAERCPGGELGTCAMNRDNTSVACTACTAGTKPGAGGACEACAAGDFLPLVAVVIVVLLCLSAVYGFGGRQDRVKDSVDGTTIASAASLIISFQQQLATLGAVDIAWASPMSNLTWLIARISFNIDWLPVDCIARTTPLQRFSAGLLTIIGVFAALGCIHVVAVLAFHRGRFRERGGVLWGSAGIVMVTFLLPILGAILAPMKCRDHPNGRSTLHSDDAVVCWSPEADHAGMLALSAVTCLLPLAYLALVVRAVLQLPRRLAAGDVAFLQHHHFLFGRFRIECYWYALFWTMKSIAVALVPTIPGRIAQIWALVLIVQGSLLVSHVAAPWSTGAVNKLELVCTHLMLQVVIWASTLLAGSSADCSFLAFATVLAAAAAAAGVAAYGLYRRFLRRAKPFAWFISHHKAAAGNFARLLKMHLVSLRATKGSVFLDSDDLKNLTTLFDYVQNESDGVIAVVSEQLLSRSWCLGELATAFTHQVRTIRVTLPGGSCCDSSRPISEAAAAQLAGHGFAGALLEQTVAWFGTLPLLALPSPPSNADVRTLALALARGSHEVEASVPCSTSGPMHAASTSASTSSKLQRLVAIVADPSASEPMCAACVLEQLLAPLLYDDGGLLCFILRAGEDLDFAVVQAMLVVCTKGALERRHVWAAVDEACQMGVKVLPVVSDPAFTFLTEQAWLELAASAAQALAAQGRGPAAAEEEAERVVCSVRSMFNEIAQEVSPQDDERVLGLRVRSLAMRLSKVRCEIATQSRPSPRSRAPGGPGGAPDAEPGTRPPVTAEARASSDDDLSGIRLAHAMVQARL